MGKISGNMGDNFWGQVLTYAPNEEDLKNVRGELVVVLGIDGEGGQIETMKKGREVLSEIQNGYFSGKKESNFESLKEAVETGVSGDARVQVGCVALARDCWQVVVWGGMGVWVQNGTKSGYVVRPGRASGDLIAVSGKLSVGGVVVLGNQVFFAGISESELPKFVIRGDVDFAAEAMRGVLQKASGVGGGWVGVVLKQNAHRETKKFEVVDKQKELVSEGAFRPSYPSYGQRLLNKFLMAASRIYVKRGDREDQRRKVRYLGLGLVATLLIMVGVGHFTAKKNDNSKSESVFSFVSVEEKINEAAELADLNPARTKELLIDVKSAMSNLKGNKNDVQKIGVLETRWNEIWQRASGIVKLEVKEVVDLTLVREGMQGRRMVKVKDKLFVLDGDLGRVVEVTYANGSAKVVGGGNPIAQATLIANYLERVFVMTPNGMVEIGESVVKLKPGESWGAIADMKLFGGNVYLLDSEKGEVWRHQVKGAEWGSAQKWLADGNGGAAIVGAKSMLIDGSIYVIGRNGMSKFTRGIEDRVAVEGLDEMWGDGVVAWTGEDDENIYVLDGDKKRIVVISKQGAYKKQFVADVFAGASDLAVDEDRGEIFVLSGGKVWAAKYESN